MPTVHATCPKCARPIPASAPKGLCPACLVGSLLTEPADLDPRELTAMPAPAATAERIGHYELLEQIGRGGMGVVFRARDMRLGRIVALKLLLTGRLASDLEVRRFRSEAEAAARLEHPNLVPIYEIGESEGRPFLAMKLMEGGSLAEQRQKEEGGMQKAKACGSHARPFLHSSFSLLHFCKVARAVHYAHQRGILHRDLKPANILLDAQGEPAVADFGLAKSLLPSEPGTQNPKPETSSAVHTHTGSIVGTPHYMAPEQARGERELTTAADVYSLGAILYELLAGQPPFAAETPWEALRKVVEEEPVPPSRITKDDLRFTSATMGETSLTRARVNRQSKIVIPPDPDLETICLKCLAKDPARRYGSAAELADDLERWQRGEPIRARPAGTAERMWKWTRRRPATAALWLAAFVALGGFVVLRAFNEARLTRERDHARREEQRAFTNELRARAEAGRAEAHALAARQNLYAADIYAAAQHVAARQMGPALALLRAHEPASGEPASGEPDVRGFEWHWLRSRCAGDTAREVPSLSPVQRLAFSPDGRWLAAGNSRQVQLIDVETARELTRFPHESNPAVLEEKGRQGLAVVERQPRKALEMLLGVTSLETEIAGSRPDVASASRSLAFSPDGRTLLTSGSHSFVKFWYVPTRTLRSWERAQNADAAFLPDGRVVLTDGTFAPGLARIIELATTQTHLTNHSADAAPSVMLQSNCTTFAVSPNGRWLGTVTRQSEVQVWNTSNLTVATTYRLPEPLKGPLAAANDGPRFAATLSVGNRIYLFGPDTRQSNAFEPLGAHVHALAFSADGGQLAAGLRDSTVRVHDGHTGVERRRLGGHRGEVLAVAWSPDGRVLASAGQDGAVRLWDDTLTPASNETPRLRDIVAVPGGFAGVLPNRRVAVWILAEPTLNARPLNDETGWRPLAFLASENALLVTASEPTARDEGPCTLAASRLADGATLWTRTFPRGRKILASPRGDRVALCDAREAAVCDTTSSREVARIYSSESGFQLSTVQFNGARFASVNNTGDADLWDAQTGRRLARLVTPDGATPRCFAFSPDGVNLISGDRDHMIRIWDARDGRLLRQLAGHSGSLRTLAVSADGRTLASGAEDQQTKLWSLATGRELLTLQRERELTSLVFAPDRRALIGQPGGNKAPILWAVP